MGGQQNKVGVVAEQKFEPVAWFSDFHSMGSGSQPLYKFIEVQCLSERRKKPPMYAFMTFPYITLKHSELLSNSNETPIMPLSIVVYT